MGESRIWAPFYCKGWSQELEPALGHSCSNAEALCGGCSRNGDAETEDAPETLGQGRKMLQKCWC